MEITHTSHRNKVFLITYTEYVYRKLLNHGHYSMDEIAAIVDGYADLTEINKHFDAFTIEFGKYLLSKNERTLEHSMQELLDDFKQEMGITPIGNTPDFTYQTHAPGGCPL